MKIYITKPSPIEFVIRGYLNCEVWFGDKPVFKDSYTSDDEGITLPHYEWCYGRWVKGENGTGNMPARLFFNIIEGEPLYQSVWDSLLKSYGQLENKNNTRVVYANVQKSYDKERDGMGINKDKFVNEKNILDRVRSHQFETANQILREKATEKAGMGWRELVLEYDVDFVVNELRDGEQKANGWITKTYEGKGFELWMGKYEPIYCDTLLIDPAFLDALEPECRRMPRFQACPNVSPLPLCEEISFSDSTMSIIDDAYAFGKDYTIAAYPGILGDFKELHKGSAMNVDSPEGYRVFRAQEAFEGLNSIDTAGEQDDEPEWGDISPQDLALSMLDGISKKFAMGFSDAPGCEFRKWRHPVIIGVDLMGVSN